MLDTAQYLTELDELLAQPGAWQALAGAGRPVELEVGSGKGLFLANRASAVPGHAIVGIELSRKYARRAAERVAKRGLANVRVVRGDARLLLGRFVPPASLSALHIYFPDPWWKARHKKRRVFTAAFVADAERVLGPGGCFQMATDVEEYFGVMQTLMAAHRRFVPQALPAPSDPEHDLDYLTNFERKYRLEGRPIWRASYRLAPPEPDPSAQAGE